MGSLISQMRKSRAKWQPLCYELHIHDYIEYLAIIMCSVHDYQYFTDRKLNSSEDK